MRHWRHLPLRRPGPGGLAAAREPPRCDIVAVLTVTMSHRGGCGVVPGAAAARREGPPEPARREGQAGREGCARNRSRPALHSPAGNSLQKSHTYAAFMQFQRHGRGIYAVSLRPEVMRQWLLRAVCRLAALAL